MDKEVEETQPPWRGWFVCLFLTAGSHAFSHDAHETYGHSSPTACVTADTHEYPDSHSPDLRIHPQQHWLASIQQHHGGGGGWFFDSA